MSPSREQQKKSVYSSHPAFGRPDNRDAAADYDPEALVEAMFAGPKAALRPIYERLLDLALSLGPDVRICPCKTMVPVYRRHVIAQFKPSTNTRIDVGFALGRTKTPKRLIDTGGLAKGDRITHRISVSSLAEIDEEVIRWLRTAYELNETQAKAATKK